MAAAVFMSFDALSAVADDSSGPLERAYGLRIVLFIHRRVVRTL